MSYLLYVTDHCTSCRQVSEELERQGISHRVINLDAPGQEWPDQIMIVPALLQDRRLLAVGPDIIEYFSSHSPTLIS